MNNLIRIYNITFDKDTLNINGNFSTENEDSLISKSYKYLFYTKIIELEVIERVLNSLFYKIQLDSVQEIKYYKSVKARYQKKEFHINIFFQDMGNYMNCESTILDLNSNQIYSKIYCKCKLYK